MSRRQHKDAEPGQPFSSEWPEFHVECADEFCDEAILMTGQGEAFTVREAEKKFRKDTQGWVKRNGRWFCPKHDPKQDEHRGTCGQTPFNDS